MGASCGRIGTSSRILRDPLRAANNGARAALVYLGLIQPMHITRLEVQLFEHFLLLRGQCDV
jgi:hypothetical protein